MATDVRQHWERKYSSLEEFLAVMDGKESEIKAIGGASIERSFEFTGTENLASAVTLARHGWPEGARRVRELAEDLSAKLESHVIRQRSFYDLEGADVNVGRYLDGNPDCMINYRKAERNGSPIVVISTNNSLAGDIGRSKIEARGAAIAALVDLIETSGARCELWCGSMTSGDSGYYYSQRVNVKQPDEALDVDRVAFCFGHPSFLRRLSFAERELASSKEQAQRMGYPPHGHGYGSASEKHADPDATLHVPSPNNDPDRTRWEDKTAAREWIVKQLKALGMYQD